MKKVITLLASLLIASSAFAASNFEEKRDQLLTDKSVSENTRKELKTYFDKHSEIYKECKAKREDLRSKLSPEAKEAMSKHFKRKKKIEDAVKDQKIEKK